MFRRYWIAGFALGLALILPGLGQAQESQTGADQAADDSQSAVEAPALPVRILQTEAEQETRERIQDEAAAREKADLIAQQGMDAATQRMAQYAFWQTVLILVGTIALIVTLWLTRQTVIVTRQIGNAQTRAYVGPTSIQVTKKSDPKGSPAGNFTASCLVSITNNGQSPAMNVATRTWFFKGTIEEAEAADCSIQESKSVSTIWPGIGENQTKSFAGLSAANITKRMGDGESSFFWIKGRIEFEDVFQDRWQTDFLYYLPNPPLLLEIENGKGGGLTAHSSGNRFTKITDKVKKTKKPND